MYKYLPSKKFSLILLSIIVALGIIYGFYWFKNVKKVEPIKLTAVETKAKVQEFMALDTDGDGMKDWEEALWKTDPKLADTDKDGTNDGDEIKANRDPLKANTALKGKDYNDKIDPQLIANEKKAEEDYNKLSETDKMGQMLFSQYVANKKIGQTFTEAEMANVIDNSLATLPDMDFKPYTIKDLTIVDTSDINQIKEYGNNVAQVLLNNQLKSSIDVGAIIDSIGEEDTVTQMNTKLKALQPLIDSNKKITAELLKIKVPGEIAPSHLSLVNAFQRIAENLSQITTATNDLVKMLSLINNYPDSINNLGLTFIEVRDIFTKKKVNFLVTDLAYKIFVI